MNEYRKGEIVALDLAGYDAWYRENVSKFGIKFRDQLVRVMFQWDVEDVGLIEFDGYTRCARVPVQFVKRGGSDE